MVAYDYNIISCIHIQIYFGHAYLNSLFKIIKCVLITVKMHYFPFPFMFHQGFISCKLLSFLFGWAQLRIYFTRCVFKFWKTCSSLCSYLLVNSKSDIYISDVRWLYLCKNKYIFRQEEGCAFTFLCWSPNEAYVHLISVTRASSRHRKSCKRRNENLWDEEFVNYYAQILSSVTGFGIWHFTCN